MLGPKGTDVIHKTTTIIVAKIDECLLGERTFSKYFIYAMLFNFHKPHERSIISHFRGEEIKAYRGKVIFLRS